VLKQIYQLQARYFDRHLDVSRSGFKLTGNDNRNLGHVDRIRRKGNRLCLTGWTIADHVTMVQGADQTGTKPRVLRQDVAKALSIDPHVGFDLDQPVSDESVGLELRIGDALIPFTVPAISAWKIRRAKLGLAWGLFFRLLRVSPALVRFARTKSPRARNQIKMALGLGDVTTSRALEKRLLEPNQKAEPRSPAAKCITVILPVYNTFNLLPEVLQRVVRNTDIPFRLILVEDCSTDPLVRPFLRDWVRSVSASVVLIENETNQGFVGSVNAALARALAHDDHVVLLNSDVFVPAGWASRLIRPLLNNDKVASVTPMSNDAEIYSVPVMCRRSTLKAGQAEAIDGVARQFNPEVLPSTAPTGVGFCMGMNIKFLRRIPRLDPIFGRGYGEEVDWCQKAGKLGGQHLGLPGLFVEHRGGESFGSQIKQSLIFEHSKIITTRYPAYDRDVQDFIQADPLKTARMALAMAWAASGTERAISVYLAHSLGGGAELYLRARIADEIAAGDVAVVLRVGGEMRWQIELHSSLGVVTGSTDDFAFVKNILAPITLRHVVYSCGVGDVDPAGLPDCLLALRQQGDTLEVLFHDFFPISPSYCLLDHDGVYRGSVMPTRTDQAHLTTRPDGTEQSLADWQAAWENLIRTTDEVVVFSRDSRDQILAVYPDIEDNTYVRPHVPLVDVPKLDPPAPKAPVVIAVLGNIGYAKGAAVVAGLAKALDQNPDLSLVLIGNIDPAYRLPNSARIHGDYQINDIAALARRYKVTCWLIPSIWPETFSYTTHEALATGLPVYCFGLGSQREAVKAAKNGRVIPFDPNANLVENFLDVLTRGPRVVTYIS